ncbi:MAG TPA: hypothetical protein VLX85_07010 [Stellaceae bacterium]|nr:hypothetical protein [Stellaceae bacterium]
MRVVRAGRTLGLVAAGGLPLLIHAGVMAGKGTPLATALSVMQVLVLGAVVALAVASRFRWIAIATAALLALVALWRDSAQLGVLAAAGMVHAIAHSALLVAFGTTLLPGREPLLTALSRHMSGHMTEDRARYTRGATLAWCGYFAVQLLASLLLLLFAPLVVWSFFINVLNYPLIVLMFAGELVYRRFALPHRPHYTLAEMMQMWPYIRARLSRQAGSD